jgi:hypothetical protein
VTNCGDAVDVEVAIEDAVCGASLGDQVMSGIADLDATSGFLRGRADDGKPVGSQVAQQRRVLRRYAEGPVAPGDDRALEP